MRELRLTYPARAVLGCLWLLLFWGAVLGCSSASRAVVHKDDYAKVFPWPRGQNSVVIRVKPQTGSAKVCYWCGQWEQVEVTPDTTFYITEKTGENFAYTPSRSPIRRLAPVDNMEIRWPPPSPAAPAAEGVKPAEPAADVPDAGDGKN